MKAILIPIVVGALGTIPKALIKRLEYLEIRGQVETIQTTTLLRSARILRRVLKFQIWTTDWRNRGRIETIQTTALRIRFEQREESRKNEICCLLNFKEDNNIEMTWKFSQRGNG